MKKMFSISAFLIIACPCLAFGQQIADPDSSQKPDSFFAQVPFKVDQSAANRTMGAKLINRGATSQRAKLAKATNKLMAAHRSALHALQNIRTIQENAGNEITIAEQPNQPTEAAVQPKAPEISQPTPTNSQVLNNVNQQDSPSDNRFVEQSVMPQIDSMSYDQFRQNQQIGSWKSSESQMRDVGDFFSPGGQPFAFQTVTGNPTFFGVDRNQCCNEWANHCNCSGGLKVNPGHLGLPWLRSKQNCDQTKKIIGKRGVCECDTCCD